VAKLRAEKPDAVVFNEHATQYDHAPLRARVGERMRLWVLDAGPGVTRISSRQRRSDAPRRLVGRDDGEPGRRHPVGHPGSVRRGRSSSIA